MDNFNLKQYLVENKLTYQEKMKDKAKKMNEEPFIDFTHGNPLDVAQGAARMEIKKRVDKSLQDLYNVSVDLLNLSKNIPGRWEGLDEKVKQLFELRREIQMILNKDSSRPLEEEGTGKNKEKEKEEPSKAPKDKSKQGPSTMNEDIKLIKKFQFKGSAVFYRTSFFHIWFSDSKILIDSTS